MKRIIEKIKASWHILTDDEYATFTVTTKSGERVNGRSSCYISDNASALFLDCIVEFTNKYINDQIK